MFSIKVLPNGNLTVLAGNQARRWIKDQQQARTSDEILHDRTEPYWTNGSFAPFDAGQANPFVGLTNAPCIADTLQCHDNGQREIVGRCWYYGNYQVSDPMEALKRTGKVIFALAH